MIRTILLILLASAASAMDFGRMPSLYGDARFGGWGNANVVSNWPYVDVVPPNDSHEITFLAWLRINVDWETYIYTSMTAGAFYCPENIRRSNPDLLAGAGGFPTNTTLAGAITVAAFPWQPYTDAISSNNWPRGVYTVAGWASNTVTVTLGGQDVTLGPGAFNRNVIPGPSASCVITGSGLISIGISRTPDSQCFQNIFSSVLYAAEGTPIITNELALCVWRLRLDASNHICCSAVYPYAGNGFVKEQTNAMPRAARILSRNGFYRFGLVGAKPEELNIEGFDARVFPWWLSETEIRRVRENGLEEIQRRGIPRWK